MQKVARGLMLAAVVGCMAIVPVAAEAFSFRAFVPDVRTPPAPPPPVVDPSRTPLPPLFGNPPLGFDRFDRFQRASRGV